jgi:hypothetical protein
MPFISSENINVVWPVLDGQFEVGNLIITYIFDTINKDVEKNQSKNWR